MLTFLFSNASLSSLSVSKVYYLQIVISTPINSLVTISELTTLLSTPQILTGTTYTNQTLNFPDQVFNTRTYVSSHVGFVLAEKIGVNFSPTDPLIAFIPHTNSFGQEITHPVGTYAINLDFPLTGIFSSVNAWQYQAGNYINNGAAFFNNGIIQIVGTKNNTSTYSNPSVGISPNIELLGQAGNSSVSSLFARDTTAALSLNSNQNQIMMRFKSNADIKFNTGGLVGWSGNIAPGSFSVKLWGSNLLSTGWAESALTIPQNWTELISFGNGAGTTFTNRFSTPFATSDFYKYLKIGWSTPTIGGGNVGNIEFYNCTMRTPNQNFI